MRVLASGYKVRVRHDRGVMPDVQVMKESTYRRAANERGLVDGRPEVAIEIVSPTSRRHDRVRKVAWYASIGVPEYWIVDVDDRLVQRLVLRGGAYVLAQQASDDDVFRPKSRRVLGHSTRRVEPARARHGRGSASRGEIRFSRALAVRRVDPGLLLSCP